MNAELFAQALKECGIDTDPPIGTNPILTARIPKQNIVAVNVQETFPLKVPTKENVIGEETKEMLISASIEQIVFNRLKLSSNKEQTNEVYSEKISPFPTAEEFVQFKRAKATKLKMESEEDHLSAPIELCSFATCLNTAVPTFKYCINHLSFDPNFDKQIFLKKCPKCDRVMSENDQNCSLHH